jgi:hypothetical protein
MSAGAVAARPGFYSSEEVFWIQQVKLYGLSLAGLCQTKTSSESRRQTLASCAVSLAM